VRDTFTLGRPETAIEEAAAAAAAAQMAVERASEQRLKALLKQPARDRLLHLLDRALTPADRGRLQDSIATELPGRQVAKLRWIGTGCLFSLRRSWRTILYSALCVALAVTVWFYTGMRSVVSNETWIVTWQLAGGHRIVRAWPAGYPAVATRALGGNVELRYCLEGIGEATTIVPEEWLLSNSWELP
jgi:hypothetical protein